MERVLSSELSSHTGERIMMAGWMHRIRKLGSGMVFVHLRDRSGICQIVVETPEAVASIDGLLVESVIQVEGTVVAESQAAGGYELHDPSFTVLSPVVDALPFPINKPVINAHLDTFLDNAMVGLRAPSKQAVFKLSAGVQHGFRAALDAKGFTEVTTPKLTGSATESGATVFPVEYFGKKAYLAQSPQQYKQMMVGVFERVYEVAPVFRAEPHQTIRHLNEYVSMDAEMGFIKDHTSVMAVLTDVVHGILGYLSEHYAKELELLKVEMPLAPETFPHVYFPDAQQWIFERHGEDCRGEPDLAPQHEKWLGEWAKETFQSDFLFVTGYPMVKRPFYTAPNPDDPTYSNSFDLLFRGTELVTGGQRLNKFDDYARALESHGMTQEAVAGYLEAFRFGMPPHGGFAIGLERFIMQLTGLTNLREAALFPRDMERLQP
ncbi:MAG: aspartate--tRNA(Asn) ligase [Candidatus Cryosericum sp.]